MTVTSTSPAVPSTPSTLPVTVLRGAPTDTELAAVVAALSAVAAADPASSATLSPATTARLAARRSNRGTWGTPAEQLFGPATFNPGGYRA
ncbi:acyl-CoA carboxylase epsilon subunit [Corynebacterium nuruki]|uniref:acyl-CoA carboxylase epsilon subunit n=1 Tax=Corynebacterium nuruki TaxID=1032851 RepID=UPI0002486A46|nr:acyl-CoA carboxylase epsilon subunit [Corynebacterium nuruki]MDN6439893.1 acetyl-CoA carboxylase subunit [Corynebacterium nuruki]